jgi:hypothetical protein
MGLSAETARRLAAARDILAVAVFFALVIFGGREFLNSPIFQKDRLTKTEAAQDIDEFFSRVERTHPAFPGTAPDYAALNAEALAEAARKSDETNRIPTKDLAYILFRSAAQFGDADTTLYWYYPRYDHDPERKFPQFTLAYRFGKFIIDSAGDPSLAGSEIIAMDGIPFGDFIKTALERVSGKTPQYRNYAFCRDQAFWWNFAGLLSGKEKFKLKLKSSGGKANERQVSALTASEFRQLTPKTPGPKSYVFSQKKIAWLEIDGMANSWGKRRDYGKFFRELDQLKITDLVLDLRRSDGGDPRLGDYLLSRLTTLKTDGPARITLLTGPGTRGPAVAMAARLRALKAGEILGSETGGAAAYFGDERRFSLSNSGIEYGVPAKHYSAPSGIPDTTILPDVQLTEALLRPYKGDAQAFVLARIERERKTTGAAAR